MITADYEKCFRETAEHVVRLYETTQQPAKVAEWKQKLAADQAALSPRKPFNTRLAELVASANRLQTDGKLAEAEAAERTILDLVQAEEGPESRLFGYYLARLTYTLIQAGKFAEAEPLGRTSLELREKYYAKGSWLITDIQCALGVSLAGQGKYAEAEPILISVHADLQRIGANVSTASRRPITEAIRTLVRLLNGDGRPEKAADWEKLLSTMANPPAPPQPK